MLVYLQAIDDPEDRTRFEAMYSAYRGLMFHAANRILQNPQDAEDAVHLAFLSLANHRLPPELGPQARHLAAVTAERKYYNGYSAAEIGELLGTTAANVRQILARAKKKLAEELAERGEIV